jgi:citrate/tricarballylate utilization protein
MSTLAWQALITQAEQEVDRQMQICNACRYCEGFCAVFPAMTRLLAFDKTDVHYLANLCHNCGACLHACQYAPPHEFAVNVPRAMAQVRVQTYREFAWPAPLGGLYQRNGLTLALAVAASLALVLLLAAGKPAGASFYSIFPHGLMVSMFAPVFLFALIALGMGVRNFWRSQAPAPSSPQAVAEAGSAALTLTYLGGGHGDGCNNEDDAFTHSRRWFHHLTFYGFALCFASTSVATLLHYGFNMPAPYGYLSLPKLLGIPGGIGLLVGTAGLWHLHRKRHPLHKDPQQTGMDLGFIALLFFIAATGLGLMLAKGTALMPFLLCAHLAVVMALFLTMPYSKFAHGAYRLAALLKFAIEKRLPRKIAAAGD